jgi:hypothetical protein
VAEIIAERGIAPLFVEERGDATVSFWLGEIDDDALFNLLEAIPGDAFALQARM